MYIPYVCVCMYYTRMYYTFVCVFFRNITRVTSESGGVIETEVSVRSLGPERNHSNKRVVVMDEECQIGRPSDSLDEGQGVQCYDFRIFESTPKERRGRSDFPSAQSWPNKLH